MAFLAWFVVEIVIPAVLAVCLLARDGWYELRRYRSAGRELAESVAEHMRETFARPPGRRAAS